MFDFFNKKTNWPSMKFEEMKKRARILVIDDKPFAYSKLFKNDGYNIEKWDDIKDLPKLETGYYDVILLDIQGVGTKQSVDQGFGILRHLRRENPSQIIVAYSSRFFAKISRIFQTSR
jgi:CheY-like chemotaxis protein